MAEMEKYYVFLSYSHADTEKYGKHHILNIKNKIEGITRSRNTL